MRLPGQGQEDLKRQEAQGRTAPLREAAQARTPRLSEQYDIPPERLARWLERWAERNAPVARTTIAEDAVTFTATSGATAVCRPPFLPLAGPSAHDGFVPGPLLDHVTAERRVGVLLVRLGAHAVGIFDGTQLVASKVDRRLVHGRHRAGGQSARRFERRRAGQARESLAAAASLAARILVPEAARLDAFVTGGDRTAIRDVLTDPRLAPLLPRLDRRILDVPEPRFEILRTSPEAFRATRIELEG